MEGAGTKAWRIQQQLADSDPQGHPRYRPYSRSRIKRAGRIAHSIAERLIEETELFKSAEDHNETLALAAGRDHEARHRGGPDQQDASRTSGIFARSRHVATLNVRRGISVGRLPLAQVRPLLIDYWPARTL